VPDYGALCDALFPDEASRDEFTAYIVRTRHPATTDPVCDHGVPIDEACAECEIIVSGLDIPFTMQAVERAVSDPVQEARKRVGAQMALVFACQDYAESYRDGDENRRMMAARSLDQARDDFRDVMFKAGQQAERDRVAALEGRTTQALVHEFHEAFKLPIGTEPVLLDGDRTGLRYDLIREELEELADAQNSGDLVGIADALADLAYVVFGAAVEYGIDLDRVIREVHRSNMTKLGDDGKAIRREDGKVLKGPHYEPPNVAAALREVKP
jgi:predicted HAD superfamily Cof-like phosphohydrolase